MANINLNQTFAPAEAERGKFAPIEMSTLSPEYSGRGRYAVLTYQINPVSLSGDINLDPLVDSSIYESISVNPESTADITFSTTVRLLEVYNNSTTDPIYLSFNNIDITENGLPIAPEAFYSIERQVGTFYLENPSNNNIDVRIIGHYVNGNG